jgi:hypothetical protein
MKRIAILAAATLLAASAFAQSTVTNSTGIGVSSGTGVPVTPGAPSATVTVMPSTSVAVPNHALLPGGAMVQHSSTTVLGGPSGDVAGSKTVINSYWANVPADVTRDDNFRRWQQLK